MLYRIASGKETTSTVFSEKEGIALINRVQKDFSTKLVLVPVETEYKPELKIIEGGRK